MLHVQLISFFVVAVTKFLLGNVDFDEGHAATSLVHGDFDQFI